MSNISWTVRPTWAMAFQQYRLPGGWRAANPFSILDQFDKWFQFECAMQGFTDQWPEGAFA